MKIAICDDVAADRQAIASALDVYLRNHGIKAEVSSFTNPHDLIAAAEVEPFDIYLLDVLLDDKMTGIDLVRKLHTYRIKTPVVFFSTSREYAVDAFAVEATSYLQKPWDKASFTRVMDRVMETCRTLQSSLLTFRTGSGVARFAATEIESVETAPTVNYVTIWRTVGNSVSVRGSLRNFGEEYRDRIHLVTVGRSLLVNPSQVATLEKNAIRFFSGRTLALPHSALALLAKEILSLSAPPP